MIVRCYKKGLFLDILDQTMKLAHKTTCLESLYFTQKK